LDDTFHSSSHNLRYASLIANASTLLESRRFLIAGRIYLTNTADSDTIQGVSMLPCGHRQIDFTDTSDPTLERRWHFRSQCCSCTTSLLLAGFSDSLQIDMPHYQKILLLSSRSIPLEVRTRFKTKVGLEACMACKRCILIYCVNKVYSTVHDARDALRVKSFRLRQPRSITLIAITLIFTLL
jgi:hypothetical protein